MSIELVTALSDLGALVPLQAGTISTPVPHIDLDLPAEYDQFQLHVNNVHAEFDAVVGVFGHGGAWWNDTTNFDTYAYYNGFNRAMDTPDLSVAVGYGRVTTFAYSSTLLLDPGSASRPAYAHVTRCFVSLTYASAQILPEVYFLNPDAAAGRTMARADKFRIFMWNDGSAEQTGENLISGSYSFFGVVKP